MGDEEQLPAANLLPVGPKPSWSFRLARIFLGPLLGAVFSFRVVGRERLPKGPYVLIANHLNWLDSFALLHLLPAAPRVHFLGDPTGLVHHRMQWRIVRSVGGYIPVIRSHHGDTALFSHVDLCLQRGGVVALFPEGQYGSQEGDLQELHHGFAHFAAENHVPVVPVWLSGTLHLWLRCRIRVTVGEAIAPPGDVSEIPALVEAGRQGLLALRGRPRVGRGPHLLENKLTHLL